MVLRNKSPAVQTVIVEGQPRTVAPDGLVTVPNGAAKRLLEAAPQVWAEEEVFVFPPPAASPAR